jgi:hypothetical protein
MKRYKIFKLVFNLAYSCNMSCDGCVSLSNIPRKGVPRFEDTLQSIREWSQVLDPEWIVPFGGEPLLNPNIKEILIEMRKAWPKAKFSLCTNGLLLRNIIDKDWIEKIKPIEIRVSLHKNDDEGRFWKPLLEDFLAMYTGWHYNNVDFKDGDIIGLPSSHLLPLLYSFHTNDVVVSVSSDSEFIVPYRYDSEGNRRPYDSDPVEAYKNCVNSELPFLYDNKLWKCITYPNLKDSVTDFDQYWKEYRAYLPSDDLTKYFINAKTHHAICSMCPTSKEPKLQRHPSTVKILPKLSWINKQIDNK